MDASELALLWQRANRRDYAIMKWIAKQARYRALHERRYGRGKPIRRLHPLARIGMTT
jgi:hypothetical protein